MFRGSTQLMQLPSAIYSALNFINSLPSAFFPFDLLYPSATTAQSLSLLDNSTIGALLGLSKSLENYS